MNPTAADAAVADFIGSIERGDYFEDPSQAWMSLREAGSLVRVPLRGGAWICTTWAGCAGLARDPRLSSSRGPALRQLLPLEHRHKIEAFAAQADAAVIALDPPEHTRVRRLLSPAFTPEMIERNRQRIERLFDDLLEDWIRSGESEIMTTLIHPFPALVIADLLGLPRGDWGKFLAWANAAFTLVSGKATTPQEILPLLEQLEKNNAYFEEVLKHQPPAAEGILNMLREMEESNLLDHQQVLAQAMVILAAGHETTRNLIGGGIHLLLSKSYDCRQFLADDLALRLAVDEILRLVSPVQLTARQVIEDFDFEGVPLKQGDMVLLAWASANRDPARFAEPERIDLERRNNPHMAFGAGFHACLGLHLARIEAQIAFRRLWTRLPNLRLASCPTEWSRLMNARGPSRLFVAYGELAKAVV